jgi:hypothetical protein
MTTSDTRHWPTSSLHAADTAFAALTCEPKPLAIDCDSLGAGLNLPPGQVPLRTLRDWLADHPHDHHARHAVWRELVLRARLDGPQWVIAAVGIAMPLLVRVAHEVCEDFHGDPSDVDAQILTGFLDALRNRIDLDRGDPYHELHDAAQRAGRRRAHLCQHPGSSHPPPALPQRPPNCHIDPARSRRHGPVHDE